MSTAFDAGVRETIPSPEPDLTPAKLLERAVALRPVLRERQALCERQGRLPEETNHDFVAAGFYRILQPRCFGGYEFALPDFIRVMSEVARGCPESAWVLALHLDFRRTASCRENRSLTVAVLNEVFVFRYGRRLRSFLATY